MTPPTPCGHHPDGRASGQVGQGTIRVPRQAAPRVRGTTCGQPCAAPTGTPFDRWRTAADLVTRVLTWLSQGGPTQAIVAAVGLEERTVAAWLVRAGQPGQPVPQHGIQPGQGDRPPVQADERWVPRVGRRVGMALALAGPSRLWRGGVLSPHRALVLITPLVPLVRACAHPLAIWVGVDGWARAVTALTRVFRPPVRTSHRGRPRVGEAREWLLGHVGTRDVQRRGASGAPRVVRGTAAAIGVGRAATRRGPGIHPSDLARLNATVCASRAPLGRRGRAIAHTEAGLTAGRWLVGGAYTCCGRPQRLRWAAPAGTPWKGQERPPTMAAGLTAQRWTRRALMRSQVPLPAWVEPKRRGRPPTRVQQPATAVAA
jgi:hypothetical protein